MKFSALLRWNNALLVQFIVHFLQKGDLIGQRHFEGIDLVGAGKFGLDGVLFRQAHRKGDPFGGGARVVESPLEQRRQIAQIGGCRKAPCSSIQHPHAHSALARKRRVLEVAIHHQQLVSLLEGIPAAST